MTLRQFLQIVNQYYLVLIGLPLCTMLLIFVLMRDEKKQYSASTLIYTGIASGYTIETGQSNRVDYFAVNNAFDNLVSTIKSRAALEEVGVRLLATHLMLRQPDAAVANSTTFEKLQEAVSAEIRKEVVDYSSYENTVANIKKYAKIPKNQLAEQLLNNKQQPYSVEGISSKLTVTREGISDMVRLSYVASDPAVVKQTLELLTTVFIHRYRDLKISETGSVVAYFEEQLRKVASKLSDSEGRMKQFSSNHKIINFYEQTKYVSAQDRDIDLEIQHERSELEASRASLKELENKLTIRQDIALKNHEISILRDSLSKLHTAVALLEINPTENAKELQRLQAQIASYTDKTRSQVGSLYELSNTKSGVPTKMLFQDWIDAFVSVDKGKARLAVLQDIKNDYGRFYKQFAPLGSTLKQLEREIDVAEREYLEILHGLNQSKLREQNVMMASTIRVVDAPIFPAKPEGSKKWLLMIVGGLVSVILVLGYGLLMAYFDQRVRTVARATMLTNLPLTGVLPTASDPSQGHKADAQCLNQTLTKINKWTRPITTNWVVIASARPQEGKSYFAKKLAQQLEVYGMKTVVRSADELARRPVRSLAYMLDEEEGYEDSVEDFEGAGFLLIEIPALLKEPVPEWILSKASFTLWICDTNQPWTAAEAGIVAAYKEITRAPIGLITNRLEESEVQNSIGDFK
jgi:uncharacterized protein involved in exopolysaccharide biosynthesis